MIKSEFLKVVVFSPTVCKQCEFKLYAMFTIFNLILNVGQLCNKLMKKSFEE